MSDGLNDICMVPRTRTQSVAHASGSAVVKKNRKKHLSAGHPLSHTSKTKGVKRNVSEAYLLALDARIWRLERQRNLLIGIFLLAILFGCGVWYFRFLEARLQTVRVSWSSTGELRLHVIAGGPLVVTHLVSRGSNEGEKGVAAFPQALAIVDSAGAQLSNRQFSSLKWTNIYNEPISSPPIGSPLQAFYLRPEQSNETN